MINKAGSSPYNRFEYPLIFDIRVPAPIDSRTTISNIVALPFELPIEVRFVGLFVWVEELKAYYHFKDGVDDSQFIPFSLSDPTTVSKFVWTSTEEIQNNYVFNHGLNTTDFIIQFYLDNKPVLIDYELLTFNPAEPTTHLNNIRLLPPVGVLIPIGLRVVMSH